MDAQDLILITREAVYVLIAISTPILLISLTVGLIISLLQALTQIQEATLTFVPKIIIIYISLLIIGPYMVGKLQVFTEHIVDQIINIK